MPEVSRFFGIIIRMYAREHAPPHFHAFWGDYQAVFNIATGKMMEGKLPKKHAVLVSAWASIYRVELMANWKSLTSGCGYYKINPLE